MKRMVQTFLMTHPPTQPECTSLWQTGVLTRTIQPFVGTTFGPSIVPQSPKSPLSWFRLFLPSPQIDQMAAQMANLYAAQYATLNFARPSRVQSWIPVTSRDVDVFIGLGLYFGLQHNSRPDLWWSHDPMFHSTIVSSVMSLNRFQDIRRFFHVCDNASADHKDPLFKLRKFLESLNFFCETCWHPSREVSMDEIDVSFKGSHKGKKRIPYKRASDGF